MKRLIALLNIILVLGLLVGGCKPAATPEKVVETMMVTKEVAVTPTPAPPVEISVWFTPWGTVQEYTLTMIKLFEARNPGITVKHEPVPEMLEKLRAAIAAGELPDLVYIDENVALSVLDVLKPIPDWVMIEDEIRTRFGDFIADFYKSGGFNGKYYILPYGVMAGGILYYNKDILEAAGYTPEDIPKTWPEFIKMAKELTIWEGGELKQAGFAIWGREQFIWDSVLFQKHGCRFLNSKTCTVDSPEAKEAAKFVMDLYDAHRVDDPAGLPATEMFGTDKAAFAYVWSWYIGFLAEEYPLINYGTTTLPTFTAEPPYGRFGYNLGFAITATDSAREEAAWKFYDFLMSDEFLDGWNSLSGSTPTSLELLKLDRYKTEQWGGVMKALEPGNSMTEGPCPQQGAYILNEMWAAILEGADIDTTMDAAAKRAAAVLEAGDYWLTVGKEGYEEIFGWSWGEGPQPADYWRALAPFVFALDQEPAEESALDSCIRLWTDEDFVASFEETGLSIDEFTGSDVTDFCEDLLAQPDVPPSGAEMAPAEPSSSGYVPEASIGMMLEPLLVSAVKVGRAATQDDCIPYQDISNKTLFPDPAEDKSDDWSSKSKVDIAKLGIYRHGPVHGVFDYLHSNWSWKSEKSSNAKQGYWLWAPKAVCVPAGCAAPKGWTAVFIWYEAHYYAFSQRHLFSLLPRSCKGEIAGRLAVKINGTPLQLKKEEAHPHSGRVSSTALGVSVGKEGLAVNVGVSQSVNEGRGTDNIILHWEKKYANTTSLEIEIDSGFSTYVYVDGVTLAFAEATTPIVAIGVIQYIECGNVTQYWRAWSIYGYEKGTKAKKETEDRRKAFKILLDAKTKTYTGLEASKFK